MDIDDDLARNGRNSISILGERIPVVYEKEIPLIVQIITTQNRIVSKGIDYFEQPEALAEYDYEAVFATTVMFSRNAPTE